MAMYRTVRPEEWLTDAGLTDAGREARRAYEEFCAYLDRLDLLSYQTARAKYFLQHLHYWTLPDGFSLPPHTINLCVNNTCNLKCEYCDFGQKRRDTFYYRYNVGEDDSAVELPFEALKSLIDQARWFRPIIRASYREPMVYKHILPLVEYTKKAGLPFWLLTNGFNLARHAATLVGYGIDSVRFSLDGPEEVHDRVCGVEGAYRRMMEGVKILLDERKRLQAKTQVGFYFTVTHSNYGSILATLEALEKEGILKEAFVNFQWLLYTTREMAERHNAEHAEASGARIEESTIQSVHLEQVDMQRMAEQARTASARWPAADGYRIHFRPSFETDDLLRYQQTEEFPVEKPRCRVLWYDLTVQANGDTRAFHHCLLPPAGNIHKASVLDNWNGEAFRAQRRALQTHGAYHGCARCWGVYALLEDEKRKDRD
ncbi:MAG: radical SAM protein [Myxococcales bacterium]|nr:MAG: radical SAM protein [Myxococcales bacterium]